MTGMASGAPAGQPDGLTPPERLVLAPQERRDAVVSVIRAAQKRLLLSVFRCTDYVVLDELAEAVGRGVRVEALLTPRTKVLETRKLKELGTLLRGMGVEVYHYSDPIVKYHAKYVVADDGPALVASLNFTDKCFTNSGDFLLLTHEPEIVQSLQKLFESDSVSPEEDFPSGLSERLIVGPDQARSRFTALLESAQKSIWIIDHKVADPAMIDLLREKKEAGIDVQVLGRGELGGLRSHGKMILVDRSVAVIGSIALAPMSLDFRREVAIVIRDPDGTRRLSEFFETMAAAGSSGAGADPDDPEDDD